MVLWPSNQVGLTTLSFGSLRDAKISEKLLPRSLYPPYAGSTFLVVTFVVVTFVVVTFVVVTFVVVALATKWLKPLLQT